MAITRARGGLQLTQIEEFRELFDDDEKFNRFVAKLTKTADCKDETKANLLMKSGKPLGFFISSDSAKKMMLVRIVTAMQCGGAEEFIDRASRSLDEKVIDFDQ